MKAALLFLVAVATYCSATPVKLSSEAVRKYVNDSRYIVRETEKGLYEVEDLTELATEVFATEDDITFYFFSQSNRNGVEIKESQLHDIVRLTGFDINKETLVVIHGWQNDYTSPVNDHIKTAALQGHDINVIVVDWSPIAARRYIIAQPAVLRVGNYIGDFLLRLDNELGHRLTKVSVVGHSLGAHIAGNIGARTGGLVDNIIGLDPAGPFFTQRNIDNRLDPTDARYVQVIHTNDGVLGFGIIMGHADYYPNGGKTQPGCGIDLAGSCAHSRAYVYYAESLNNNNFISRLCSSYSDFSSNRCNSNTASFLGSFPIDKTATGEYFLETNSNSPYARG